MHVKTPHVTNLKSRFDWSKINRLLRPSAALRMVPSLKPQETPNILSKLLCLLCFEQFIRYLSMPHFADFVVSMKMSPSYVNIAAICLCCTFALPTVVSETQDGNEGLFD